MAIKKVAMLSDWRGNAGRYANDIENRSRTEAAAVWDDSYRSRKWAGELEGSFCESLGKLPESKMTVRG